MLYILSAWKFKRKITGLVLENLLSFKVGLSFVLSEISLIELKTKLQKHNCYKTSIPYLFLCTF